MSTRTPQPFDQMMKMFDPAAVARMFDPQQMMAMFSPPPSTAFDLESVMRQNQKNYEAMVKANQSAAAAYQDFYERQMAILRELMEGAKALAESDRVSGQSDAARKQARIYQAATEKAFANMAELAEESRRATERAFSVIEKQLKQSVAELQEVL